MTQRGTLSRACPSLLSYPSGNKIRWHLHETLYVSGVMTALH